MAAIEIPVKQQLSQTLKDPCLGINYQFSWATHGTNIDAPYHLC
jgi:hypothetical protein